MPEPLSIPTLVARRFLRRAQLLDRPAESVGAALTHLGYVQLDPLNICGRMHDLILRNRVAGYCEGDLLRHLYGGNGAAPPASARLAFEHYLPRAGRNILVAFSVEAWPHLRARMRRRQTTPGTYGGRLPAAEARLADRILDEIGRRGALTSDDIEHEARARTAWGGPGRLVKIVLEKLFFHGRVLITRRERFRRVYDLPERVLAPASLQAAEPTPAESARWLALLHLRQRRLTPVPRAEQALIADCIQAVTVPGCPPLFCLRDDVASLTEAPAAADHDPGAPLLLAPLDPLVCDRRLTHALWDFDYTWEAYTPASRRRRGHYALPVLAPTGLVGHVNPKADRPARRLRLTSRSVPRGHRVAPAVRQLARFLGLR